MHQRAHLKKVCHIDQFLFQFFDIINLAKFPNKLKKLVDFTLENKKDNPIILLKHIKKSIKKMLWMLIEYNFFCVPIGS